MSVQMPAESQFLRASQQSLTCAIGRMITMRQGTPIDGPQCGDGGAKKWPSCVLSACLQLDAPILSVIARFRRATQ
jgi:hypothetical protein